MKEIWKDILGYEGLYQVNECGNVKSLSRTITKGNIKTIWKDYKFNEDNIPQETESKRDKIIRELALENNLILVDLSEMKENPKNYAWGEYGDGAIASHPSDKGMKFIADRILENLLK